MPYLDHLTHGHRSSTSTRLGVVSGYDRRDRSFAQSSMSDVCPTCLSAMTSARALIQDQDQRLDARSRMLSPMGRAAAALYNLIKVSPQASIVAGTCA
jgi:hypothetical protein